ncbi:MAG: hypothetical protein ACUVS4_15245 [Chloroflexaceae bacterium]
MPQRSITLPLSLVIVFAVLMLALLVGVLPATSPVSIAQSTSCPYPDLSACPGAQQNDPPYPGVTSTGTPTQAAQSQSTPTATTTATIGVTTSPTPTPTTTPTRQPPTATFTAAPTRTRPPAPTGPTPTPTSALPDGITTLVCVPGVTVTLTGSGPPSTALLAYFNNRPVGGGFSRADGTFSIDLLIGPERPGQYLVEVRKRDGRERVSQWGCEVPGATPTPTLLAPSPSPPGSGQGSDSPTWPI